MVGLAATLDVLMRALQVSIAREIRVEGHKPSPADEH